MDQLLFFWPQETVRVSVVRFFSFLSVYLARNEGGRMCRERGKEFKGIRVSPADDSVLVWERSFNGHDLFVDGFIFLSGRVDFSEFELGDVGGVGFDRSRNSSAGRDGFFDKGLLDGDCSGGFITRR